MLRLQACATTASSLVIFTVIEAGTVCDTRLIKAHGRLRQEDGHQFKASLLLSELKPAYEKEWDIISKKRANDNNEKE